MSTKDWINKVIQGDCLELMKKLPDKSIDMILCDLPYGITANPWDKVIDFENLWIQYRRIIKENGAIVLTSQGLFTAKLILSNPDWFKYKIVWIKSRATNYLNANKQLLRKHEDICVFYNKQPPYYPQRQDGNAYSRKRKQQNTGSYGNYTVLNSTYTGGRYPTDVVCDGDTFMGDFVYCKTSESEGTVYHPNQKPVALGRYLIRTYTKPGAIVLDNACGSGSFLVAAIKEGRKFIGIELGTGSFRHKTEPIDFINVARQRVRKAMNEIR
ncbi:MAG: site-specific DNA-methyltransferase [Chitinophagaceae bacterium]|nr:site-specific DNA-methyltransferase [Chitinophagaceae bacterium]